MRNYPVFVPHGTDHIAAVITVPDEEPRGLVLLLTGGSAARSHRFKVWTRTARRLADEHALASVRMDYRGTGDSTGSLRQWRMSEMPVDQALAVLSFARRALGVDRVAVAGNCMGSRVGLAVAAEVPECIGAICIRSPILGPSNMSKALEKAGRLGVISWIRSNAYLRRMLVQRFAGRKKTTSDVRRPVLRALSHGHLLFLYSEQDFTFNEQVERELNGLAARLPAAERSRYELRVLAGQHLKGFESLDIQRRVIESVVEWMGARFASPSGRQATGERPPVTAAEPG